MTAAQARPSAYRLPGMLQGPAEHELVTFFGVTPPAVHGMIVKLAELGLITREPGVARSARAAVPDEEVPPLEDVEGPAW